MTLSLFLFIPPHLPSYLCHHISPVYLWHHFSPLIDIALSPSFVSTITMIYLPNRLYQHPDNESFPRIPFWSMPYRRIFLLGLWRRTPSHHRVTALVITMRARMRVGVAMKIGVTSLLCAWYQVRGARWFTNRLKATIVRASVTQW